MRRKAIVRIDTDTIDSQVVNNIISNNRNLKPISRSNYMFEFNDVVFAHALMLLGIHSTRFGYDLQYYLNNVSFSLKKLPSSEYIILDTGSPDFKRKASEDFGVGLSSLFMVESFNIQWHHISQIYTSGKSSKPDFIAISGNDKYVFESKGTTQANKISEYMDKAILQKNSYNAAVTNKFAFVSYLPNNSKIFPTYIFVADPPEVGIIPFDSSDVQILHYVSALEYSNFVETSQKFLNLLIQKIRIKQFKEEKYYRHIPWKERNKLEKLSKEAIETFNRENKKLNSYEYKNSKFVGKFTKLKGDKLQLNIFLGIDAEIIEKIVNFQEDILFPEDSIVKQNDKETSIFSDGTIFCVEIK